MATLTEIRKMTKPQLVDLGCEFFVDEGNLRAELKSMKRQDLEDLLVEQGAAEEVPLEEPEPLPDLKPKTAPTPLDLGSY